MQRVPNYEKNSLGNSAKKCSFSNETDFSIGSDRLLFTLEVLGRHSSWGDFINRPGAERNDNKEDVLIKVGMHLH